MRTAPALSIIIPVYNERRAIIEVLERVRRADSTPYRKEIVVVDDGSSDDTGRLLSDYAVGRDLVLLRHSRNRGKAAAIRTGLAAASGSLVLIQDADLEYSTDDYPRLLSPFASPEVQVVYGSRFLSSRWPQRMLPANWLANRLFTFLVNLLYGARITDEGTAYKAFRTRLLRSLDIQAHGFDFCAEVTAKLLQRGVPITEVPIGYAARSRQEGKKPRLADGVRVLWRIVRVRLGGEQAPGGRQPEREAAGDPVRTADGSARR